MLALARRQHHWPGPVRGPVLGALDWTQRRVLTVVRAHPIWSAALAAMLFGLAAGGLQAMSEGYVAVAAALVVTLLGCGMFAFLVVAGSYLGLVRSTAALAGARRRAVDAITATCVGVLVALAFRNSLWWICCGGSSARARPRPAAAGSLRCSGSRLPRCSQRRSAARPC